MKPGKWLAALLLCANSVLAASPVVINEIHYEPVDKTSPEEFVELFNASDTPVDLSGWSFSDGILYTFPEGVVIPAHGFMIVAQDPQTLARAYGDVGPVVGPFAGQLANGGEEVILRDAQGAIADQVEYDLGFPWPLACAGDGGSMELINPSLDNDLGGSWRSSGLTGSSNPTRRYFVQSQDAAWRYRKGTSNPPADWRQVGFVEDGSWQTGQTSIGFGDNDDRTTLADMINGYTSVYLRHTFTIASADDIPTHLMLGIYVDDGAAVWINGSEAGRFYVAGGDLAYNATATNHEMSWEEALIPNPASFLRVGENVIAIHALNTRIDSSDFSIDATLFVPADNELVNAVPTPGARNSVFAENAPPQIRQVDHAPLQPRSGEEIVVTAKVTDPEGVASVLLLYQFVAPGDFIPAYLPLPPATLMSNPTRQRDPNPDFEDPASWTTLPMGDDGTGGDAIAGDGIYTATLPGQPNRTLVRYRIAVADLAGASVRVPYQDDKSLNFACFAYDGIPPYRTTKATVRPEGVGYAYPPDVLSALPVYFLITRADDFWHCLGYDGADQISKGNEAARDKFNWEGALVYNGKVYDHMNYRLRQANDRYGGQGKRSFRFRFNRGMFFQAYDNYGRKYPSKWRSLCTGKMVDNKRVGNFGVTEKLNHDLWNATGTPAPWVHTFHWRVIRWAEEAPANADGQYLGDFYGMALSFEDYDSRFIEAHDLADGNLYKLKDGIFNGNDLKRNQGRFAVTTDADFQNIRANLRPERTNDWLDANVNYDRWYPYHAVCEGVRHYDFVPADSHSKNRAWYFEPDYSASAFGRLWTLPWDSDASWGPSWNWGVDYSKNAIFSGAGKEPYKMRYRNSMRQFRDLVWTEEVIKQRIDDLAARIVDFAKADRDRWRNAPFQAGSQDFGTLEAKISDMKNFAFVGWSGSSGETVPAGGRAAYLTSLAAAEGESGKIPAKPQVASTSPAGFPADALAFAVSAFSDPQGDGFGAMRWRLGEITPPGTSFNPALPRKYEVPAVWEVELPTFEPGIEIPRMVVKVGSMYRVRARMADATGRWSNWSDPVQFTVGQPLITTPQEESLRITEIMYHPADDSECEFVEIQNIGASAVAMGDVSITGAIEYSFAGSLVTSLGPGEYAVVVKDVTAFASRYDTSTIRIAGTYRDKLDNAGESLTLMLGLGVKILEFTYEDTWYPTTDGGGYSLVIKDPGGDTATWSDADAWRESLRPAGSPGGPDIDDGTGRQRPGDMNQDRYLDLSDAVAYLRYLFSGRAWILPCGDGTMADPSNLELYDLNASGGVNVADAVYLLGYLFAAGPPPAAGTSCLALPGCADACGW